MDVEQQRNHEVSWERYMDAERRELEARKAGQLGTMLGVAMPGESQEQIDLLASGDRSMAEEERVALRSPGGGVYYKHIDNLVPEDRPARAEANRARIEWIRERGSQRVQPDNH